MKTEVIPQLKLMDYFENKQIGAHAWVDLVRSFELEEYPEDHYVINVGEYGDRCFLILQGEVSVQIDNESKKKELITQQQKIYSTQHTREWSPSKHSSSPIKNKRVSLDT